MSYFFGQTYANKVYIEEGTYVQAHISAQVTTDAQVQVAA